MGKCAQRYRLGICIYESAAPKALAKNFSPQKSLLANMTGDWTAQTRRPVSEKRTISSTNPSKLSKRC
ncbi:hypothetical protein MARA_00150 (plasmid) [Mycolicibacterium arabiense]|uniref:Uncharacterized protein n=1 Tax=Mycolicibacterium arabiense TaxID=1286181 RepID=A0A7I7RRW1_9MYCO|nr:hypothetical protein MARA_00150 [Mycolicibacterium arabiense]